METTPPSPAAESATDAHTKALAINLDSLVYGSFAEIGAGQEVARWFLRVGAAAGTVAQTISAYDKAFSDDTYGAGTRYVSRERLASMLDHEYQLLIKRLATTRDPQTRFFAFADTVAARNYKGDNEQHGWLGIRFQAEPGSEPSDVLIHVNLMDSTALLQQEATGRLGVNLIYAAFHQRQSTDQFLAGMFDGLSLSRIEVDSIELSGPAFAGIDVRRVCLTALRRGMCHALVFDSTCNVVEPSGLLRKRPLIVERGMFEPIQPLHGEMLLASQRQLAGEGLALAREPAGAFEITTRPLIGKSADDDSMLEKVQRGARVGMVIVSSFSETYMLIEYLRRYTSEPIRIVMGVSSLARLLAKEFYTKLPGSLLEGLGRVLATNVKVYVQPMPKTVFDEALRSSPGLVETTADPMTADTLRFKPPVEHLYRYLREAQWIVPLVTIIPPSQPAME
jgi:hypothetical protein